LLFYHIGVAGLASLPAGELHGTGADLAQCSRSKVPILAEIRGNNHPPDKQERRYAYTQER
jgi:hypothetical protein